MRDGYRIIDADRHVIEPLELWSERLPPELRAGAPRRGVDVDEPLGERVARLGSLGLLPIGGPPTVDGKVIYNRMSERAWLELNSARYLRLGHYGDLRSGAAYLEDMNRTGVDVAFLYPTYAILLEGFAPLDAARACAFASVYNEWLHEFCSLDPQRLRGVGLISAHDPAQMLPELERAARFGWKAVILCPNPVGGRRLDDPAHEPFWAACERLSIAVALHHGPHSYSPTAGADRFDTRFAALACAHPMEQMLALLGLISGGVLERYPGLRVAALEAGAGWLPYWLWRLDEVAHRTMGGEVAEQVRMKPSAYFRRQYFASIEPDEPSLVDVVRQIGDDNLLFGTDFPHLDHDLGMVDQVLALRGRLSSETIRKILWDNPARFYGLEG